MIELREVRRDDIAQMVSIQERITKAQVTDAWTRMVEGHLDDPDGVGFVAVRSDKVVGFVIGAVKGEGFGLRQSGWIEVVGVDPQAMGEGVGKTMLDALFQTFRSQGITDVHTAVRWDAVDLVSFFKSVGFGRSDFINLIRKL